MLTLTESYIKKGIQQGLRPEFAIFCGLHKDDPRAVEDPGLFEKDWFNNGPQELIIDTVIPFWLQLKELMAQKLVHDGKAWSDRYGHWLIHDEETLDQAKARVDDRERQRLREQATEKYEAELEQKRQEWKRLDAEEDARQREAEMLERKQSE